MISLLLDFAGAYIIAKRVHSLALAIVASFLTGVASSVTVNLLNHVVFTNKAGETMSAIAAGLVWHPVFATVAMLVFRRENKKSPVNVPDRAERGRRRELALEAQRQLKKKKETGT